MKETIAFTITMLFAAFVISKCADDGGTVSRSLPIREQCASLASGVRVALLAAEHERDLARQQVLLTRAQMQQDLLLARGCCYYDSICSEGK